MTKRYYRLVVTEGGMIRADSEQEARMSLAAMILQPYSDSQDIPPLWRLESYDPGA